MSTSTITHIAYATTADYGTGSAVSVDKIATDSEGSVVGTETVNDEAMDWDEFDADRADEVIDGMGYDRTSQWTHQDGYWAAYVQAAR